MTKIDELERELREHYLSVAPAKLEALASALADVRGRPGDRVAVEQLRFVVHKIAGSAGSYGFGALSAAAKLVEQEILAAPGPLTDRVLAGADQFLARMEAEFAAARR